MSRRKRVAGLLVAATLALAGATSAEDLPPADQAALLDRLETAFNQRDIAAYLALWDFPTSEAAASEAEFARERFAAEDLRLTLQRPVPGTPVRPVHGQVFSATEPRARVEQFSFRIGSPGGRLALVERQAEGLVDGLAHLTLDPAGFRADGLTLRLPDFELRMDRGSFFLSPPSLGPTVLVFVGEGRVRISPGPAAERDQLRTYSGRPELDERVESAFVRLHPADFHHVLEPVRLDPDPTAGARLAAAMALFREQSTKAFVLDTPLPGSPWWLVPGVGDAVVSFRFRGSALTFAVNANDPENVTLFDRERKRQILLYPSEGRDTNYSEDDNRSIDILSHDIEVKFEPDRFFLRGEDALTFELLGNTNGLRLRLDDSLRVLSITSAEGGDHIFFRVRGQNSVVVSLGPYSGRQGEVRLVVRYVGVLNPAPAEDETTQAVVRDLPDEENFIEKVLLYTNKNSWYPRNASDDHARYRARFDVPAGYAAVSGGRLVEARTQGDRVLSEFRQDEPGKYLTVIVGRLTRAPVPPAGQPLLRGYSVPRQRADAEASLASAREILDFFAGEFGPCPYSFINLVVTENVTPGGHSPPGLVLIQRRPAVLRHDLRDDPASFSEIPGFFLAHELAHQWWGQGVAPQNYHERWLAEGVAQYAAALWVRKSRGEAVFQSVLKRFAVWSLRYADAGPITLGYRIGHLRDDPQAYRAVVYDKGAYVLHMLRGLVGEEAFRHGLLDFQGRHRYGKGGTEDLRQALETASGMDLRPYFEAWIGGVSIPELALAYRSELVTTGQYRTSVHVKASSLPGPVPLLVWLSYPGGREERHMMLGPGGGSLTVETRTKVDRVEINGDHALLARIKGG